MAGTRDEWLAARLELLEAEKELTRRGDELARRREALPWVRVDKDYRFETDEGSASLADLFRGRSQLLVYLSLSETQSGWQVESNWVMFLVDERYLHPDLVGADWIVPVASVAASRDLDASSSTQREALVSASRVPRQT
jgi:hypothetical protein